MNPNVPVGPSTVAGYTVTVAGLVAALLAFIQGDRSEQTLGVLTAGGIALVAFVITQVGRYLQAKTAISQRVNLTSYPVVGKQSFVLNVAEPGQGTAVAGGAGNATGTIRSSGEQSDPLEPVDDEPIEPDVESPITADVPADGVPAKDSGDARSADAKAAK